MTTHCIESFVNCDVEGFVSFETSTGSAWTTRTISTSTEGTNYFRFRDYLTKLSAALSGWVFTYDATADRVNIDGGSSAALKFRFSQSMADLIGFPVTTDLITGSENGAAAPKGIVPTYGSSFLDSTPARTSDVKKYAHGRARGIVFGSGTIHRCSSVLDYSSLDRLLGGPCSVGRVRIGPSAASTAYSSDNTGGYVEGSVTTVGNPSGLDGVEGVAEVSLTVHQSASYSAPEDWDGFWGNLERGYSLFFYARIEGIPFVFTQGVDPGWTDALRTTSATLVVPDSTSIRYSIDREAGVAQSAPIQIGIIDADNTTGIFGKPSKVVEIAAGVSTAAQATLDVQDTTGWTVGEGFWLGKEYMKITSVTGSPDHQFGVTRGTVSDKYLFATGGGSAYTSITDRPHVWGGRWVELWCGVLDAFGRSPEPSSGSWDNTSTRQIWTGEIAGTPGYDSGIWAIHLNPMIKRIAMELSSEASGETAQPMSLNYFVEGPLVVVDKTRKLLLTTEWTQTGARKFSEYSPADGEKSFNDYSDSGDMRIVNYYEMIDMALLKACHLDFMSPDPDDGNKDLKDKLDFYISAAGFEEDEGSPWIRWFRVFNHYGVLGKCSPYLRVTIGPGGGSPKWWNASIQFDSTTVSNPPSGTGQYQNISASIAGNPRLCSTGANGKNIDSIVISASADDMNLIGTWPSSGYVYIGDQELCRYTGKIESSENKLVGLYGLTRGVDGTVPVDVWAAGQKAISVKSLSGLYGEQMLKMIQSSGTETRGTYDVHPMNAGYAIGTDHVSEASLKSAISWSTTSLIAGKSSLKAMFGSMLGGMRQAISPIRVGQRLPMGLIRTTPVGAPTIKLRDEDLRLRSAASVQRVGLGPNILEISTAKSPHVGKSSSYTYRLLADIAARGGISHKISIPGMDHQFFATIAQSIGGSVMLSTMGLVCYEFNVGPHKDWLPGQVVDIDVSHPGIWDWKSDQTGLDGVGVVLQSTRRLSGECKIVVLVGGQGTPGALCPSVRVTRVSGTTLTLAENSFPSGGAIFKTGDPVLIHRAGVSGSYTEATASSVSGTTMVIDSAPGWLPSGLLDDHAGVLVTYPSDDNSGITDRQKAYTHFGDGRVWV